MTTYTIVVESMVGSATNTFTIAQSADKDRLLNIRNHIEIIVPYNGEVDEEALIKDIREKFDYELTNVRHNFAKPCPHKGRPYHQFAVRPVRPHNVPRDFHSS